MSVAIILFILFFLVLILIPYGIYKLFSLFKIKWLSYLAVILYFPLLVSILLPNFVSVNERSKPSSLKANMHVFQTMLETYSVDTRGYYPKNVDELKKFANTGKIPYWKDFKNPYTREKGKGISYDDFSKLRKKFNFELSKFQLTAKQGCIYYYPIFFDKKGIVNAYAIYGSLKNGELLIVPQTEIPFTLSNN